jgi:chromosome segregation ATPase
VCLTLPVLLQLTEAREAGLQRGDDSEDTLDSLRDELRLAKKAASRAEKAAEAKASECERKLGRIDKLQATIAALREETQNASMVVVQETGAKELSERVSELEQLVAEKEAKIGERTFPVLDAQPSLCVHTARM